MNTTSYATAHRNMIVAARKEAARRIGMPLSDLTADSHANWALVMDELRRMGYLPWSPVFTGTTPAVKVVAPTTVTVKGETFGVYENVVL